MDMLDGSGALWEGSLLKNITFWSALTGWLFAQSIKIFLNLISTRKVDFSYLVSTGGMPSAHSSMVCALATSVGLRMGFGSTLFAVALAFAIIVLFDAQSVRHAAGLQAKLLNQIVDELFKEHHFSQKKLKELLGHTRLEVFMGMVIGILIALLLHGWF